MADITNSNPDLIVDKVPEFLDGDGSPSAAARFGALERDLKAREKREEELLAQIDSLTRKNAALLEILGLIESDKKKIQKNAILPLGPEIPGNILQERRSRRIIKENLRDMTAMFAPQGLRPPHRLSLREVDIANLVKAGQRNKDIASTLNISVKTVETIRNKIRRKLGLVNKSVNLISYFRNI